MDANQPLTIGPDRAGYVWAGVYLALAAVIAAIIGARGLLHGPGDWIVALLIIGGLGLLAWADFLQTLLARIVADGDTVKVRDRIGRWKTIRRSEISHATRRSIIAPLPYIPRRAEAFMVVGVDGRCLIRLAEDDYSEAELHELVAKLSLEWPVSRKVSIRELNREVPGAYAFDFQRVVLIIAAGAAVVLALVFILISAHR